MARFRPALVVLMTTCTMVQAGPLSLPDAFERVVATNPELRALDASRSGLIAERAIAGQRPALMAGASLENAFGTGAVSGVHGAELTLSLASVLERGDKRARRVDLAQRRIDAVDLLREAKRLDVLAEVARRYLDAVAVDTEITIALREVTLREQARAAADRRVQAGGAPVAVRLAADADLARAIGTRSTAERARRTAVRRLSALWGAPTDDLVLEARELMTPPHVPDYSAMQARLAETPELRRFASEARLREARVQLARSARVSDLSWELGVRRLQDGADVALMGSVSIPLGSTARSLPGVQAAEAELDALAFEREGEQRQLEATLAEVYGRLDASAAQSIQIAAELLPRLRAAEASAAEAYARGALSFLEWAQLQGDMIAAEREQLAASVDAWRALIELQRLTADSFSDLSAATGANP